MRSNAFWGGDYSSLESSTDIVIRKRVVSTGGAEDCYHTHQLDARQSGGVRAGLFHSTTDVSSSSSCSSNNIKHKVDALGMES